MCTVIFVQAKYETETVDGSVNWELSESACWIWIGWASGS
jgi:hypothetical protein